jgi:hypothetical protein
MASFRHIRSAGLQREVRAQVSLSPRGLGCPDRGPVLEATADAGRWMQAPPQQAKDHARTPQRLGRRDQASDLNKGAGEPGVVDGGGMEPAKVGVDRPDTQSAIALDAGEDQVAANDDGPPRHIHHAGGVPEHPAWLRRDAALEVAAQGERLDRGHAHTLPVDRVEAGDRGAHHQQAVREAGQPLIAVPDAGRECKGTGPASGSASRIASEMSGNRRDAPWELQELPIAPAALADLGVGFRRSVRPS